MIVVVDYRAGNLTSVQLALEHLGYAGKISSRPEDVEAADRVIFPGVGAAGEAMHHLNQLGLSEALKNAVAIGKPFLGICLGYQVLFDWSEEDGGTPCLGLLPGRVQRFDEQMREEHTGRRLKIPQMGWNRVAFQGNHPVWDGLPSDSEFYFVHAYYAVPSPQTVCAITSYGLEFASGAARDNLVAFQFHPEKSGRIGLKLLENFCRWQV